MNLGWAGYRNCHKRSLQQPLRRAFRVLLCLTGLLGLIGGAAGAGQDIEQVLRFKAAFIYHFAQFVEWPPTTFANDQSPFVIGVLGKNPFGSWLKNTVEGKSLNEHRLVVKAFSSAAHAKQEGVHILFISDSEKEHFAEIANTLRDKSVLTIISMEDWDSDHFLKTGFMINLVRDGPKIRFHINEEPAKQAGLKISAKLLSLAMRSDR